MTEMTPAELLKCMADTGMTPRQIRQLSQHGYDVVKREPEATPAATKAEPAAQVKAEPAPAEPHPAP